MIIFLLLFLLFAVGNAGAATRTVATTGANVGNCIASPCLTINYALGQSVGGAGDIIEIRAGTYNESPNVPSSLAGTSYATGITIRAFAGETAIIRPPSASGSFEQFAAWATIGSTAGSLHVDGQNLSGPGSACQHNITNNASAANARYINVDSYDNAKNFPLSIRPCAGMKQDGANVTVSNSRFYRNGMIAVPKFTGEQAPYGFYWAASGGGIYNSEIYDNGETGIQIYSVSGGLTKVTLQNNRWHGNGVTGNGGQIYAEGSGHVIQGNVLYDGVQDAIFANGCSGCTVEYNTVNGMGGYGIFVNGTMTVRNNIVTDTGTNIHLFGGSPTFAQNLCSGTGGTANCTPALAGKPPLYVNAALKNFALQSGSPAIGQASGTCSGMTDIAGVTRPQAGTCDIGAYEFGTAPGSPSIAVSGIGAGGTFLSGVATATTTGSTITLSGLSSCPTSATGVTWSNNRSGTGSATGGTGTGPQGWTATAIPLSANLVSEITFTLNCPSGNVSTSIKVRANGADAIVLMLPFNENTGTTAVDISPSGGNNASFTGSVANTWVPGKFGSAIQIATNGGLTIPNSASLNPSLFTLSAYVYPQVSHVDYRAILRKHPTGGDSGYMMYATEEVPTGCGTAGLAVGGYLPNESGVWRTACSTGTLPLNTWSHVVITADGQNVRFYLDGALIQTNAAIELLLENTGALNIGFAGAFGEYFQGAIDELVILNKAVPATGASDACSITLTAANATVAKLKNCALGTPPPGQPTSITIGVNSTVTFGPGATATIGVQTP